MIKKGLNLWTFLTFLIFIKAQACFAINTGKLIFLGDRYNFPEIIEMVKSNHLNQFPAVQKTKNNFGFFKKPVWFAYFPSSQDAGKAFSVDYFFDEVRAYCVHESMGIHELELESIFYKRGQIFTGPIDPTLAILFKVEAQESIVMNLSVDSLQNIYRAFVAKTMAVALYYGVLLLFLVVTFFAVLRFRTLNVAVFFIYSTSFVACQAAANLFFMNVDTSLWVYRYVFPVLLVSAIGFSSLFLGLTLKLKYIGLLGVCFLFASSILEYRQLAYLLNSTAVVVFAYFIFAASWKAWRYRDRNALRYLASWFLLFLGVVLLVAKSFGIGSNSFIANYWLNFSTMVHLLFIGFYSIDQHFKLLKARIAEEGRKSLFEAIAATNVRIAHDVQAPMLMLKFCIERL